MIFDFVINILQIDTTIPEGGADVILSFGRLTIFCSPVVPWRQWQTRHLEMRCLTTEFAMSFQAQRYASARVNNFLMSITNGSLNYETFLQEDNHRMLKVFRELLCLPSLSTMQISPSLSRKESRHYRVLYFLISDFFTFVNWRSVLESAR